jgi:tetratricopeptide (TPR) repeat protein
MAQRQAQLDAASRRVARTEALAKNRVAAAETLDDDRAAYEGARAALPEEHASALLAAGRVREAAELLRALHRERPADPAVTARLGLALAKLGDREGAAALSADAAAYRTPLGRSGPINTLEGEHTRIRAAIAAQLGDAAAAGALLRQAESEGLSFSPGTLCDPDFAPLRGQLAYEEWRAPRAGPRAGES